MLSGSLSFSLMGALAHQLGAYCDWQVIALARAALALVFAAVLALAAGARFVVWKPRVLWMRNIAGSLSLVGTFYALTRLPVADVLTLTNMFPVWVALLSWPLLGEAPTASVWLAVGSGLAGVALIQQPHFAAGNFAVLVALASSLSTAVAMLGLHRLQRLDPRAIVVHFSAVASVFCVASFFLFGHGPVFDGLRDTRPLVLLLGVGVTATVGQLFLTRAFAAGPAARVSVVSLVQVVFALALDVLLFERRCEPATLLGMGLVVAPTAWLMSGRAGGGLSG
jgi:drug/metabolite transporter (DMT)-like permease